MDVTIRFALAGITRLLGRTSAAEGQKKEHAPFGRRGGGFTAAAAGLALLVAPACGDVEGPSSAQPATSVTQAATATPAPKMDPNTIPKFAHELTRFHTYAPTLIKQNGITVQKEYTVEIAKFSAQQLPPGFPQTPLFGYGGQVFVDGNCQGNCDGNGTTMFLRTSPGPKFEQTRGIPALIHYRNALAGDHPLAIDPTLDWANPNNFPKPTAPFLLFPPGYSQAQSPIAHTTHTHGIEVDPSFDGTPDTWFTAGGIVGPEYVSNNYLQPSSNQSTAFWYHDHTFGVTRLDVGFGLSGFSMLRDPNNPLDKPSSPLPQGEFEVGLILQDRSFRTDGTVFYPTTADGRSGLEGVGADSDVHPYWVLNQDGDTNVVNGRVWPNMNVKRQQYRFRMLNSANQRFYHLYFSNGMSFQVIGTDGGFLPQAKTISSFTIGVTERVDFLVDFSQFPAGTQIILRNDMQRFPPLGIAADPNNDGIVMRFTVVNSTAVPPQSLRQLNTIATLTPNRPTRTLVQNVELDETGDIIQAELDGQLFHQDTTELPTIGSTEDWDFVNTTPLTHNKHVHLIQFLLVSRQNIDAASYLADWKVVNGNPPFSHPTLKLPVERYLIGMEEQPFPEESGWKDTIRTPAGQMTRIRVRWAPQLPTGGGTIGVNDFPINPIFGIGFIWHCHLVEHEDNEMMRPMTVIPIWASGTSYPVGNRNSPGVNAGLVDFQGVNYQSRVAISHSTQSPPQRFDLWARVNNQNGDWAVQTIYNVGDRVFFQDFVYRALQQHQAVTGTEPNVTPTLWQVVTRIPHPNPSGAPPL